MTTKQEESWPSEAQKKYWDSLKGIKGKNAPNYKKEVGISQVHRWLDVHYGKLKTCEGDDCRGTSKVYD